MKVRELLEGSSVPVSGIHAIQSSGFAETFEVISHSERYFVKYSHDFPERIVAEKRGLDALREAVPEAVLTEVFFLETHDEGALLMTPFVSEISWTEKHELGFGELLAKLHSCRASSFGFDHDNFIGSTPQKNNPSQWSWGKFFYMNRVEPQRMLGIKTGWLTPELDDAISELKEIIIQVLDHIQEPPVLCHGDLWSGNTLASGNESVYLIDPAVSYSNRETDIAFMYLFGGFSTNTLESYNRVYPLLPDASRRFSIYNLYHLMNHANIYGGSYREEVARLLGEVIPHDIQLLS